MRGMAQSPGAPADPGSERRPQARGLATRTRVLDAARELFIANGYERSSVGQIAERADVGVGTLYHHFPDKRAVLLALVEEWAEGVLAERRQPPARALAAVERLGTREVLSGWIRATHDRLCKEPSLWVVVIDQAGRDAAVGERLRSVQRESAGSLARLFESLQQRGEVRAEVDPLAAAWLVRDAIERAGVRTIVEGAADPPPETVIRELVEMICRYLLVDPAP
jgi:AcrR family transcriptional regulator